MLRFYRLEERPFHHDESLHAYYSYYFETEGEYRYNPMLHGPFLFYSNALIYRILGDSDFTARLLPAVFGVLLIYLCLCLSPYIGKPGALCTAFFMAISPTMVYFSRFLRNDIYIAVYCVGILLAILMCNETKKYYYWYIASALFALAFCTKEVAYFVAFSFISFGVLLFLFCRDVTCYVSTVKKEGRQHWQPLCTCFFIFWIVYLPFYTVFFHHPEDWNGFSTGLKYWYHQHQIQRIGGEWWYYLPFMGLYELLPTILGICAFFYIIRKRIKNPLIYFLIYWFLTSFFLYSYAGEKVPWLLVHIVLPLILLSGWYVGRKIEDKKYWIFILVIPLVLLTMNATCLVNFRYPALDPQKEKDYEHAELMEYVQSTYDIPRMVQKIKETQAKSADFTLLLTGESVWPLSWYFRDVPKIYFEKQIEFQDVGMTVIVSDPEDFVNDQQILGENYEYQKYSLRAWWPEPSLPKDTGLWQATRYLFQEASLRQRIRYFLFRETFWQGGSTDVVLWVKKG